ECVNSRGQILHVPRRARQQSGTEPTRAYPALHPRECRLRRYAEEWCKAAVSTTVIEQLAALAKSEPDLASLAALQAAALRVAALPFWEKSVPPLDHASLKIGMPLLHGVTFTVEAERITSLLLELSAV